ncbi:hypothetical protein M432DRAFT_366592 [Thermoascus aurantiacus ATCC 26904]
MANGNVARVSADPYHESCVGGRMVLTCRMCAGNPGRGGFCSYCNGRGFSVSICPQCNPAAAAAAAAATSGTASSSTKSSARASPASFGNGSAWNANSNAWSRFGDGGDGSGAGGTDVSSGV